MDEIPLTIGVDFGGTSVKIAVVHQSHIIDHSPPIATQDFAGHEELILEMCRSIADLRARHPAVAAIGVGMPGFVNFETGLVYQLTNVRDWTSVPLKSLLQQQTGLPVAVDNDANCMAVAEWKCGAGRGFQHVVFMTIGTGVGGAIIANGQMIRGAFHGAGEIGQTSIDYQGRCGHYGNLGALEDYIGNAEISAKAREAYRIAGIPKDGPRIGIFQLWPHLTVDWGRLRKGFDALIPFFTTRSNCDERILTSYLSLIAGGQMSLRFLIKQISKMNDSGNTERQQIDLSK